MFYNITNTTSLKADSDLEPLVTGAWGFFRRLKVIVGGQIEEDIDYYTRLHEQFHMMKPTENRLNHAIKGFGMSEIIDTSESEAADSPSPLPQGHTQTVCFTP